MSAFRNIWKIKELRSRIFFTLGLVFICRMLSIVPTPGVDASALKALIARTSESAAGGVMGTFDLFTGGALSNFAVGTLSIWPYISASIIIQLMTAIIPALERMAREGESGRQKLNQTTRYLTLALCAMQSFGLAKLMENPARLGLERLVMEPGLPFEILTVLTMTAATMLTMWLGEQITERGIGNGTSVIIMVNICARLPDALYETVLKFIPIDGQAAEFNIFHLALLLGLAFIVFAGTIALTQGVRRIPIHTARRSVGNRAVGGQNTYMPLRVNYTGVMPIIFAGPILMAIGWLFSQVNPDIRWLAWLHHLGMQLKNGTGFYMLFYAALILFFSFFWVATQFHAVRIADELKSSNSYIPGIRPGMPTAEYLDMTMTRVTLIGAIGLIIIAVLPTLLTRMLGIPARLAGFFGGTSLLIIVGVALDTLRQVESYLVMRNYEGFLKHGRLRGRR
ncbi:MAG: preprotein translocase subunit SecY [Kiritimatiellia bacterium]|jgi:preprotein translocase subunit SecY